MLLCACTPLLKPDTTQQADLSVVHFCRTLHELPLCRFLDQLCVCYKSVTQYYRMLVNTPRLLTSCRYVAMHP